MNARDIATALIHRWEGCALTAYPDPATGDDPWTVGYGATGPGIEQGTVWTQQQADDDLSDRLQALMVAMQSHVPTDATDHQLGACLSFAYNVGLTAFLESTLLRLWNAGDVTGSQAQFARWNLAGGRVMQGLANRRADEARVFGGEDP